MTKKVFISYSHKDEAYRLDLEEHLTMLKRQNIISIWHDRKITAGDDWKHQIDSNIESADIIIFLVSSSFLSSDYCYDIEVKRAIERCQEGTAKIISVIVRACDWNECEFSKFQAVPKDGKPIAVWEDRDTAWLDVIQGLKKHINEFTPKSISETGTKDQNIRPSDSHLAWLDDTEIVLVHRKVDKVKLSDIYVLPDLECNKNIINSEIDIIESSRIFITPGYYLLAGEEQQGKTALLKHSIKEFLKKSYLPVYFDSRNINKHDIKKVLSHEISKQYENLDCDKFLSVKNRALLIDNFDEIGLNSKYQNIFLEQVNNIFDWVVITCHSSYSYIS
ncbi:MAG: TIR domain-containing protein [Methylobacter sp.]